MAIGTQNLVLFGRAKHILVVTGKRSNLPTLLGSPTIDVIDLKHTPIIDATSNAFSPKGVKNFQAIPYPFGIAICSIFCADFFEVFLTMGFFDGTHLLWMSLS